MSDREKAGLRGPVRTCVEEIIYPGGKFLTTTEYSTDGRVLTIRTTQPDGSEWVSTQTYDADGRLTKTISGKANEPGTETLYTYDFHYDEQGRKAMTQSFDPETLKRAQSSTYTGSPWDAAVRAGIGLPVGGNIKTIYDGNGQPTEAQIRDGEGRIVSRFVRSYDAYGRIIEEKQIQETPALIFADKFGLEGGPQPTAAQLEALNTAMKLMLSGRSGTGILYAYDAQGRITKIHDRNFAFDKVTTISYNEHGDKSEERETITGNSAVPVGVPYTVDDNGTLIPSKPAAGPTKLLDWRFGEKEVRYAYQYDSYGNWTQQTANDRSRPNEPPIVRHRTITYH